MGDKEKFIYHNSVLNTFFQHPKTTNKGEKTNRVLVFEDKKIIIKYKPVKWYYLQGGRPSWKIKSTAPTLEMLFDDQRLFKEAIKIKGLHFPGAVERHSGLKGTEIEISPENLLCLIYAPTASLYYQMAHKGPDGKYDNKLKFAIVIPHIVDMKKYSTCFQRYLKIPLKKLSADSLGDAALACLVELKAQNDIDNLGVSGCTVISMGTAKWSDKQKTRTKVFTINRLYEEKLRLFDIAYSCLPNRVIIMEKSGREEGDKYFVATSICRGLIANNIALGFEWFKDFYKIMRSKKIAEQVYDYERRELSQMVEHAQWSFHADRLLVESIHNAIRNRYGELADRAGQRGADVHNLFKKEFERMRSSLMRAKNSQTLRAELADMFARGKTNKTLQGNWAELLPLFTGPDWQRARDLALLALASYAGKGVEYVKSEAENAEEDIR